MPSEKNKIQSEMAGGKKMLTELRTIAIVVHS